MQHENMDFTVDINSQAPELFDQDLQVHNFIP